MNRLRLLRISAAILALSATAAAAPPPELVESCLTAYGSAQKSRAAKRFLEARDQLLLCARPECPELARKDCSEWLADIQKDLPSIVIVATDAQGQDLTDVSVFVDGATVPQQISGEAIQLDPGPHTVRFERAGSAPVEQKILLRVGERNRALRVTFAPLAASRPTPKPAPKTEPESAASIPTATLVLGGVGLVALGSFAFFGATGESKRSDLESCKPDCDSDDVSAVRTRYIVADVSLVVGVLALGGATYFYLSRPAPREARTRPIGVGATLGPRGGWAGVAASF